MSEKPRIVALLAITASMLVFLGVFGLFRRRCGNRTLASVAFCAYNLSPAIIAYTLGLIQSAPYKSLNFPVWAAYLVVVLGSGDSYTVHSIEDIEQWKSFNLYSAAKCFMTSWMIASYTTHPVSKLWAVFLFVILFAKVDGRARALMLASNSVMEKKYKLLADYMSTEHQHGDSSHEDPATMRGYKYLVRLGEEEKVQSLCSSAICKRKKSPWLDGKAPDYLQMIVGLDGVITVEKVWDCQGRLLKEGDPNGRLKDLCLSFSLFKFICMRFAGYSLPQEAHNKLRRLIQHMLNKGNDHERVFKVIEVELAFLFDLLYTKYPVNLSLYRSFCRLLLLAIVVAAPLIANFSAYYSWGWQIDSIVSYNGVTFFLMMSILVNEFVHICIMIFSEWAKVRYICKYVQNDWWLKNRCSGKLIEIMCQVWLLKPWGRQLRQYSLLQAYSYSPWKCINNRFTTAYFDQEGDGQQQIPPTNLSKQVKMAIARSLWKYLEKGQASLRRNDLSNEFSWACNLETTIHVIMVWHIATTFCEHKVPCAQLLPEQIDNFDIATKLSQYLAYLVAYAPRLLPGHPCRTQYIFGRAVSEARETLRGSFVSMEKRIEKLEMGIDNEQCPETIVGRGTQLGMKLMNGMNGVADMGQIWKVLADFWADMILYVAPSNNTAAHAKYLTTGGEFVTHVWVLVSHIGITRDPQDRE
ncbi:hypothetical protein EUGRSUZ_D00386 [Eucalyptus grandis]|uniref:Uncharacterized protein n=2 Tax=Eucalyptus grandis TaxID=71139 RepID=A0ACC3L2Z1_EUCGR|nr:hypothetical protein EUGRSUZ_D00386 [Eucalyptus grandis]